jgi:hypothetical protein
MTSFPYPIRIREKPVRSISILEFLQRPVCATQMIYMLRMQRLQRLQRVQGVKHMHYQHDSIHCFNNFVL